MPLFWARHLYCLPYCSPTARAVFIDLRPTHAAPLQSNALAVCFVFFSAEMRPKIQLDEDHNTKLIFFVARKLQ